MSSWFDLWFEELIFQRPIFDLAQKKSQQIFAMSMQFCSICATKGQERHFGHQSVVWRSNLSFSKSTRHFKGQLVVLGLRCLPASQTCKLLNKSKTLLNQVNYIFKSRDLWEVLKQARSTLWLCETTRRVTPQAFQMVTNKTWHGGSGEANLPWVPRKTHTDVRSKTRD